MLVWGTGCLPDAKAGALSSAGVTLAQECLQFLLLPSQAIPPSNPSVTGQSEQLLDLSGFRCVSSADRHPHSCAPAP